MRSIPTLYHYDEIAIPSLQGDGYRLVGRAIDEARTGCEWVLQGKGVATRKLDGQACLFLQEPIKGQSFYRRFTLQLRRVVGKQPADFTQDGVSYQIKQLPPGFIHAQPEADLEPDASYGYWPGWVPVTSHPGDRWLREGLINSSPLVPDTYELCGPSINRNPERLKKHVLIPHGQELLTDCPRDYEGIFHYLQSRDIEGIVFWREQGNAEAPMAKIRKKDFGLPRRANAPQVANLQLERV